MTDYTITTDFGAKDSLPSGNAAKVIKGSEFTTEFTNIKTAVNSKADTAGDTFTGAVTFDAAVTLNADVTFDTNTMFVDVSENRVGIGNVAPATALDVTGVITTDGLTSSAGIDITGTVTASGLTVDTNTLHVDATNNRVGIGTTSPSKKLHVSGGDMRIESNFPRLYFTDIGENSDYSIINNNGKFSIYDDTNTTYRMAIDSSGNVGIGTTSPASKLHVQGTGTTAIQVTGGSGNVAGIYLGDADGLANGRLSYSNADNSLQLFTNGSERMRIDSSGNVGIGTTSPDSLLEVVGADPILTIRDSETTGANTNATLRLAESGASDTLGNYWDINHTGNGELRFVQDRDGVNNERMRINYAGNVGIGTTSPSSPLHVTHNTGVKLSDSASTRHLNLTPPLADGTPAIVESTSANGLRLNASGTNAPLQLYSNNTERMRIDSSGNLLVGKTATGFGTAGIELFHDNQVYATSTTHGLAVNRLSTNGDIAKFYRDSATVGSIGTGGGDLNIGTGDVRIRFNDATDNIIPLNESNGYRDAAISIGDSTARFKDLYRSGSTYSTSDRNKKQDIRDITDAEARVAVVAKGSLKAFRYIDTVEAEGDDANIHFGIIAQDLKAAFEAEGLNADSYQVLKTSTYTDDDGVEQTTYSVCYENLLAFIISAI